MKAPLPLAAASSAGRFATEPVAREEMRERISAVAEAGRRPRLAAARVVGEDETGDDMAIGKGVGQHRIVIRQLLDLATELLVHRETRHAIEKPQGRGAIGLGEYGVEDDDGGAHLEEFVDQRAHLGARPRPLPDALEAGVVDVDDAHWHVGVGPRRQALEHVEDAEVQLLDGCRLDDPQRERQPKCDERREPARAEAAHGPTGSLAPRAGYEGSALPEPRSSRAPVGPSRPAQ